MIQKLPTDGPNAEQIEYWNETVAEKWTALAPRIDAQIGPFGIDAMDAAQIGAGQNVLDVGCGCGATVLELARRIGPSGRVTGVDVSAPMLAEAARRAHEEGLQGRIELRLADAQTAALERAAYDRVYSRFGVMFFSDPAAAFANLRRSLRPQGRLAFVCWRRLEDNPWMAVPLQAASRIIDLPPAPDPEAPGPFSLAGEERIRRILVAAGWEEIRIERVDREVMVGGTTDLDEAVEFLMRMGPTGRVLRETPPQVVSRVAVAIRESIARFARRGEGVRMPASAWVVTARP